MIKMVKNDQKWPKMTKNDKNDQKRTKNDQNEPKFFIKMQFSL